VIERPEAALLPTKPGGAPRKEQIAGMLEAMLVRKVAGSLGQKYTRWKTRGVQAPTTTRVFEALTAQLEASYESRQVSLAL